LPRTVRSPSRSSRGTREGPWPVSYAGKKDIKKWTVHRHSNIIYTHSVFNLDLL
jgi:hypothetical protein